MMSLECQEYFFPSANMSETEKDNNINSSRPNENVQTAESKKQTALTKHLLEADFRFNRQQTSNGDS